MPLVDTFGVERARFLRSRGKRLPVFLEKMAEGERFLGSSLGNLPLDENELTRVNTVRDCETGMPQSPDRVFDPSPDKLRVFT